MRPLRLFVVAGLAGLALTLVIAELRAPKPSPALIRATTDPTRRALIELWEAQLDAEIDPSCSYHHMYPDPTVMVDCGKRGFHFERHPPPEVTFE